MNAYAWLLTLATFFSALMAGFLFAFSVVVMPGIKQMSDRNFLRSFQAIDRVIQNGQPLFMTMWLGSSVVLLATAVLAALHRGGADQVATIASATASILFVQLPTMTINIPLNNGVQSLDLEALDDAAVSDARESFEPRWNRWNRFRTVVAIAILGTLLWLLWRL